MRVIERFFPEVRAGGFSRRDGTVEFYGRLNALIKEGDVILDCGAGRGRAAEDGCIYRRKLQEFHGCKRIAVDVDAAVLENRFADESYIIEDSFPLDDSSCDIIICDHVFEHIDDPKPLSRELNRVLRPGGWICGRTPHKFGYIALGARAVPNKFHVLVLKILQPEKPSRDTFPTKYRINTMRKLRSLFPGYENYSYGYDPEPGYTGNSSALFTLTLAFQAFYPVPSVLMCFLRKPSTLA